ncbi:hypothetical protein F4780DRAFT_749430 [Xylariomycetidae sp. FL0641]|nr:hypothetical protein F4780DRAFT_749430 [Xylariomycetidae sp. FL0641]
MARAMLYTHTSSFLSLGRRYHETLDGTRGWHQLSRNLQAGAGRAWYDFNLGDNVVMINTNWRKMTVAYRSGLPAIEVLQIRDARNHIAEGIASLLNPRHLDREIHLHEPRKKPSYLRAYRRIAKTGAAPNFYDVLEHDVQHITQIRTPA